MKLIVRCPGKSRRGRGPGAGPPLLCLACTAHRGQQMIAAFVLQICESKYANAGYVMCFGKSDMFGSWWGLVDL